jgi:diguanylate cyclase (GGDEF)-like protein
MEQTTRQSILIVDDTPANIDVLGAMLMDHHEIRVAVNGPMALEIANAEIPPDLILLDIMMPGMDGYEVARQLKSSPVTREIPIIFVTAKIEEKDEAFGFTLGAVDYIRKPVSTSVTLARIKSQLALKQYRDNLTAMVAQKIAEVQSSQQLLRNTEEERIRIAGELKIQAFHDTLTGIPNRALLMERLKQAIELKQTTPNFNFSVLLLDLDRFKSINDSLGHQAGDKLLIAVTARIQSCLRSMDTIARLGGDEFAIILHNIRHHDQVTGIAERIREVAENPFIIDGYEAHISASIGIVMDTENYGTCDQLLRDADLAMYHAKERGKDCFKIFTPAMHHKAMERITLEKELRNAIENADLELYYQPIIGIGAMELEGFEALIRWNHPCHGLVTPDKFIPLAEETGLILPMGEWIIKRACQQLKKWKTEFTQAQGLTLSINVSIKQFLQKNFVDFLFATVSTQGLSPGDIKIELTESLLMAHTESAVKKLEALRACGFALVLDDFGTGYSSLSYLQQFPIDTIKIDRSFVSSLETRKESVEIVKSIISLSKSLGMSVVAEGVEKKAQLKTLAALACDSAQGYLFARPMDCGAASLYIKKGVRPNLMI